MRGLTRALNVTLLSVLVLPAVQAQVDDATLTKWVAAYRATEADQRTATFANAGYYVGALKFLQEGLMHQAEANRIDKQTESSASAAGSTSTTSKGSVPWLFAFALEHGALTQSVDGNLITMKGNVANMIKAMSAKDYLESYDLGQDNLFVRAVSAASFSLSFNANQGNASPFFNPNTISNASAHIDLYNRRDPRDRKWRDSWRHLTETALASVANSRGRFTTVIQQNHVPEFQQWRQQVQDRLNGLAAIAAPTDQQIKDVLAQNAKDFANMFSGFKDVKDSGGAVLTALEDYASAKGNVASQINHSPVLSFEYGYTNQSTLRLPSSSTSQVTVSAAPPNLSNFNLIFCGYLVRDTQFTLNASTDLFNSIPGGSKIGRVRDYRASGQLDVPLPQIPNLGSSALSFSGVFLSLLEEPLGQQVLVNSVPVSTRGNIRLFQARWTIPVKGAGVRIPISFTTSNRTELIKESDKRGSIGISFDFDNLFSKP